MEHSQNRQRYHREDHRPIELSRLPHLAEDTSGIVEGIHENRNTREMYKMYHTSPTFQESIRHDMSVVQKLANETQEYLDIKHLKNVNSKYNRTGKPKEKKRNALNNATTETNSADVATKKPSAQPRKRLRV